jgi:hypothetical protein
LLPQRNRVQNIHASPFKGFQHARDKVVCPVCKYTGLSLIFLRVNRDLWSRNRRERSEMVSHDTLKIAVTEHSDRRAADGDIGKE